MVYNILSLALAYLIGSIPSALLIGKLFYSGVDIREQGSGNLGSTNMLRTLGIKAALATAVFDILVKGSIVTLISITLHKNGIITIFPIFIGIASAIGHAYPIFANFKGGKCVATAIGILLFVNFKLFLLAIALLIIVLIITKIMALGSFLAVGIPYLVIATNNSLSLLEYAVIFAFYILILYLHRQNIYRIITKQEKQIDVIFLWKTKVLKQQS